MLEWRSICCSLCCRNSKNYYWKGAVLWICMGHQLLDRLWILWKIYTNYQQRTLWMHSAWCELLYLIRILFYGFVDEFIQAFSRDWGFLSSFSVTRASRKHAQYCHNRPMRINVLIAVTSPKFCLAFVTNERLFLSPPQCQPRNNISIYYP